MTVSDEAFAHHPELRDKIADPMRSFMRGLTVEMLVERYPELEAALEWVHSDDEREATRTRTLSGRDGGDLWVFAYGSLIRYIAHGSGFLGTSHSYLANIVSQLNVLNIHDPDCVRLLKEVDEFLGARESGRPGEADQ